MKKEIDKKYVSKKDDSLSKIKELGFGIIEDTKDLSELGHIAAEATKKGFIRAKRVAHEIIIVQNGKLIRKRPGKPNQIISKMEERQVVVGKITDLNL